MHAVLAAYASDEGTGDLYVALNPRIASAIMGTAPYARIDLGEVRKLDSDPARLIHQRLCGWIDPGKSGGVGIETISAYVWPDDAGNKATKRKRWTRVRKAISEIKALGWRVEEIRKDFWQIVRPRIT